MDDYNQIDDKELIRNIQNGDEQSFEILYKKYISRIFNFINRILQSHHLTEEVVQDTFLKLYTYIPKYEITDTKFSTFLYKIAYHTSINKIKSLNKEKKLLKNLSYGIKEKLYHDDPYCETEQKEKETIITKFIESLSERERIVYHSRVYEDLSNNEIAKILNISTRTIIRIMNNIIRELYKVMQKNQYI